MFAHADRIRVYTLTGGVEERSGLRQPCKAHRRLGLRTERCSCGKKATKGTEMEYREHWVTRGEYRIYVREYNGEEPAIVLMHGFPDNLHLYDRLVPHLVAEGRRVVVFDFLGWGRSDKPKGYPYTADNQAHDLAAVVDHLALDEIVPVAHDASGPPAIDWALWNPERTAALVLLNTYYGRLAGARPPEAIFLFSTPVLRNLARFVSGRFDLFRRVYRWQVGRRFIRDEEVREEFVPLLYEQFAATPSTKPAFFSLNADLQGTMRSRSGAEPEMRAFERPVRIVFGEADSYLNANVARRFQDLFPRSELFLLPTARHFPQLDEPEEVARLILSTPLARRLGSATGISMASEGRRTGWASTRGK
jgi:haloalkane dehalogenase